MSGLITVLQIQNSASRSPDLQYKPSAIDVIQQSDGTHAVFIAGEPRSRADNVEYLRRIDVMHFSPDDEGASVTQGCVDVTQYAEASELPVEAADCRIFTSGLSTGFYVARLGAIESDEQDVGTHYRGAIGLVIKNVDEVYVTSSEHTVSKLDLSQQLQCDDWMTNGMYQWDVPQDGLPYRTSPVKMRLSTLSGSSTLWQLEATKMVGTFKTLGVSENWQANRVGDPYIYQKNTLCALQMDQNAVGDKSVKCCVTKHAEALPPPEECPKPVQATCENLRTVAMHDYEYTLQIISRNLNLGNAA
jgi:hypothetical protein